jgi:hypothetical protein
MYHRNPGRGKGFSCPRNPSSPGKSLRDGKLNNYYATEQKKRGICGMRDFSGS